MGEVARAGAGRRLGSAGLILTAPAAAAAPGALPAGTYCQPDQPDQPATGPTHVMHAMGPNLEIRAVTTS